MRTKEQKEIQKKREQLHLSFIHEYKIDKGCERCGYKENPYALQFDHIDPSTKHKHKNRHGVRASWGMAKIVNEISKCRVLCGNCHAIRTHDPENF